MTCPNGHRFNVFAVYRSFYQRLEFASRIVDYMTEAIFRDYAIEGTQSDRSRVENAFQRWNFWDLFNLVVKDTVLYGNAFLIPENGNLTRIDPADADFNTGYSQGGGQAYVNRLNEIGFRGRTIRGDDVYHFSHIGVGHPMGMSVFGGWFLSFYTLQDGGPNDYSENQILTGAGLPVFFTSRNWGSTPRDATGPAFYAFRLEIQSRRETLEHDVELMILPLALGREWSTRDFPRFKITGAVGPV